MGDNDVRELDRRTQNMMISPTGYIDGFRNSRYSELIEERNKLLRFIQDFEEKELSGNRSGKATVLPAWK